MIDKNNSHFYDDMISQDYHKSKRHAWMPQIERGAQFAPFAALTGHREMIQESERVTEDKKIIDQQQWDCLNQKIAYILLMNGNHPPVTIKYFVPDQNKVGGQYQLLTSSILKIDTCQKLLIMSGGMKIPLNNIYDIDI